MIPDTLQALRGSIAKWRAIVDGTGKDEGVDNCPLCKLFHSDEGCDDRCPVKQRTSQDFCFGSPYVDLWVTDDWDPGEMADTPIKIDAAESMLGFLISLLPEGDKS